MKKFFVSILTLATFATVTTMSSCTKTCDTGYEGNDCKTEVREKFTGTTSTIYHASEDGTLSQPATYDLTISKSSSDVSKILISNVWDSFSNNVVATVEGNNLTIASQEPDGDGYTVSGTGTISGSVITVSYNVTNTNVTPNLTDAVTGTWTKQ